MSVSLNTSTLAGMSTQDAQKMENIAKDFKKLESDLKSGDLSAAKQDYVTLKSDLPATSSTSSSSSSSQTNPMDQLLTQLGKDLDSGNISAAKQDFSEITLIPCRVRVCKNGARSRDCGWWCTFNHSGGHSIESGYLYLE